MSGPGSCSYFILQKPNTKNIDIGNDDYNKVITIDNDNKTYNLYILPYNNIDYYKSNGLFEKGLIDWMV